ncbi:hypothetical protein [Phyllobacterium endophyticum]|uniref:hypothetical protein n=1 Tax=Phyllobacterium endophyticum TaxID=1149773 RepID=UPI0011CA179B|nr:hypothetical protein [Phyllobacterium endophyticum]TXR49547.1 hypothetical protein FVA77_09580 [Phyllobacterium endophyticum]
METAAIDNRNEFALWAIQRAHAIVSDQGTALALAARESGEDAIREAGNALGKEITHALLEAFDGLLPSEASKDPD